MIFNAETQRCREWLSLLGVLESWSGEGFKLLNSETPSSESNGVMQILSIL